MATTTVYVTFNGMSGVDIPEGDDVKIFNNNTKLETAQNEAKEYLDPEYKGAVVRKEIFSRKKSFAHFVSNVILSFIFPPNYISYRLVIIISYCLYLFDWY